jgi:hypothetical protein
MRKVGLLVLVCSLVSSLAKGQVPPIDSACRSFIAQDFERFNPQYKVLRRQRAKALRPLERQVFERESEGLRPVCAREILLETRWLRDSTADFARIDRRLQDLREALGRSSESAKRNAENASGGDYTSCYTEWFFKLDALYDYQKQHRLKSIPSFLDRVNSPEKLQQ